ncbi:MAG: tetratricopeptide repeat protein [Bacteroidales bacterium]|nr:tetratricopeptide repeat protein [Bacteroidales bacterium]
MVSKKKSQENQNLEAVETALSRTEMFIEDNSKLFSYLIIGVIVIAGAFIGVKKLIIAPKQTEASAQMFMAEQYFEQDSFNLALNGDGNYLGFLDIIDEYKITKAAKLANYYAGISFLQMGQFSEAIEYLSKFSSKDEMIMPIATGAIGDAHAELNDFDKAIEYYLKAANMRNNEFTSPLYLLKAGELLETQDKAQKALDAYNIIKDDYPDSNEARQIPKYIERAKQKI